MTASDKVLSVLQLFSSERAEWTVEAAASELGLAQSTAYEYFRTLTRSGLIASTRVGRYVLGSAVIELDRIARQSDPILVEGAAVLESLVQRQPVQVVALLCRLYRMRVMCVDQRASKDTHFAISYERGRLMPLFRGAASKVILANIERRRMRRFFEENSEDIESNGLGGTWEAFRLTLRRIRSHEVYVTRGEIDAGRVGLSIPLLTVARESFGSISLVVPEKDYDRSEKIRTELDSRLMHAASTLSKRIASHY
jgi:DNA-binding IclR family transcriptional regulator